MKSGVRLKIYYEKYDRRNDFDYRADKTREKKKKQIDRDGREYVRGTEGPAERDVCGWKGCERVVGM